MPLLERALPAMSAMVALLLKHVASYRVMAAAAIAGDADAVLYGSGASHFHGWGSAVSRGLPLAEGLTGFPDRGVLVMGKLLMDALQMGMRWASPVPAVACHRWPPP